MTGPEADTDYRRAHGQPDKRRGTQDFPSRLRRMLSLGLVGGFLFGCREAIVSHEANAAVQPDQYLFVNIATPILAWVVLGVVVLVPVGLVLEALPQLRRGRTTAVYVAVLTFVGLLSMTAPTVTSASAVVRAVGSAVSPALALLVWVLALTLVGAAALLVAAVSAWCSGTIEKYLPFAAAFTGALTLLLLWPVVHFLATDWKWGVTGPPAIGSPARSPLPVAGDTDNMSLRTIEQTSSEAPNVLLISIDTLRADHLGSYGDEHGLTPRLDHVARQGVTFTQTITSSPWTLPAMASLFTAQYPRRHGAGGIINDRTPLGRSRLPAGAWTLTRALQGRSYRTHAIVTNPYLALRYGFGEAFDSYENITVESESFVSFSHTTIVRALTWLWPQLVIGDRAETVSSRAGRWLDGARRGRPFFLWLHYIDPHAPYSAPGATVHKSMRGDLSVKGSENEKQRALSGFTLTSPDVARLRSGEIRLSTEEKETVRDLYRAEVASVDAAVGRVLDALDRAGLSEHTLLVVVGDHGEEFWEHGGVEHGRTVYEEVVRIPLLLRWPGHLPAGRRVDALARITDVAPTILDLLGMAVPGGRDGETLLPLVRGETSAPRLALIENMLFAEERIGIRTADRKYVLWENGKEEVYDLSADPQERVDLAGIDGALAPLRETYARLEANGKSVASPPSLAPEITSGTAAALSALGYLN